MSIDIRVNENKKGKGKTKSVQQCKVNTVFNTQVTKDHG